MSQSISPPAWLPFRRLPAAVLSALWMVPIAACVPRLEGQSASNVLLVVNRTDPVSPSGRGLLCKTPPGPRAPSLLARNDLRGNHRLADLHFAN